RAAAPPRCSLGRRTGFACHGHPERGGMVRRRLEGRRAGEPGLGPQPAQLAGRHDRDPRRGRGRRARRAVARRGPRRRMGAVHEPQPRVRGVRAPHEPHHPGAGVAAAMTREPAARPAFSPVVSLLTVSAVWEARLDAELRAIGLTTRKYGLLAHIRATPGISFSELARRSQITVQSAHSAVRSLVDADFVADATAHAGAASVLRVTDLGGRVLDAADGMLTRLDAEFAAGAPALGAALEGLHEDPFTGDPQAG